MTLTISGMKEGRANRAKYSRESSFDLFITPSHMTTIARGDYAKSVDREEYVFNFADSREQIRCAWLISLLRKYLIVREANQKIKKKNST